MQNIIEVKTWNNLQEVLFEDSWNPRIGRYRSRCAFRGLSDCSYDLKTTLYRLGGEFWEMEHHLLRNFVKYAHKNILEEAPLWHWLSVAQHHGLPTRLMDWTYSPFVAMHFATANQEKFDQDGVIWVINYVEAHKLLPDVLKEELQEEGANAFTVDMMLKAAGSFKEFSSLLPDKDFVLFFEPPSLDDRFVNQFALFTISSNSKLNFNDWMQNYPQIWKKIIIPAKLKWEIRDKLDQSNITERVLFPGLDGLSEWLKRMYRPREIK